MFSLAWGNESLKGFTLIIKQIRRQLELLKANKALDPDDLNTQIMKAEQRGTGNLIEKIYDNLLRTGYY